MSGIELLLSCGVEFEFVTIPQNELARNSGLRQLNMNVTHDASSETPAKVTSEGLLIENGDVLIKGRRVKAGGELVSDIWFNGNPETLLKKFKEMTYLLQAGGEVHKAERSGIHFHIAYDYNIDILRSLMVLGAHLEKVFFTLGGMGYANRGITNDAIYFRPITGAGPLCVPLATGGWAKCFTIESLLTSNTASEFFLRYGDMDNVGKRTRYFPTRYHWLNLANLVLGKKTLEFRVFNVTLDALSIWAALQFSTAFARLCLNSTIEDLHKLGLAEENSIFTEQSTPEILATAEHFMGIAGCDSKVTDLILAILATTPPVTFEEYHVKSHLHFSPNSSVPLHWNNSKWQPDKVHGNSIKDPQYVDYHTLTGNSRPSGDNSRPSAELSSAARSSARLEALEREFQSRPTMTRERTPGTGRSVRTTISTGLSFDNSSYLNTLAGIEVETSDPESEE